MAISNFGKVGTPACCLTSYSLGSDNKKQNKAVGCFFCLKLIQNGLGEGICDLGPSGAQWPVCRRQDHLHGKCLQDRCMFLRLAATTLLLTAKFWSVRK